MTERLSSPVQRDPVPEKGDHIKGRGRVLTYGLFGGGLLQSNLGRHTNGALEALKGEKAYQGGPSAADRMDL